MVLPSSLLCPALIVLFSAQSVFNLMSNEADKALIEQCSRYTEECKRNSFLWTLENYPSVYIFGSIHRPYSLVWPQIPRNVKRAFRSSKKVYFEIDLTSFQYLSTIMKCQYLPNRQTLADVLPPRILKKLRKYLDFIHSQIPEWLNANQIKERTNPDKVFQDMTKNWQRKRPIWILLQLASFNKEYVQSKDIPSLDFYMFLEGKKSRKSFGHLESPEEHCGVNNVNSSQAIIYLDELLTKYNLATKEKHDQAACSNITYHYFCGNLSKYIFSPKDDFQTTSSRMQTLRKFEDSLTRELFERRNKQIMTKITREIKFERKRKNRKLFFTVGAGHLVGSGSIIDLLTSKGFKPKHISVTDALPRFKRYKINGKKKLRYETKKLRSRKLMKKLRSKIFKKKLRSKKLMKKLRYKTREKKENAKLKSSPTLTSTNPLIEITEERIILDVNRSLKSSPGNSGIRTTCKLFTTFFVSWIVYILM